MPALQAGMDPMAPAAEPAVACQGCGPAGAAQLLHVLQAASPRYHSCTKSTSYPHTASVRPGLMVA